MFSRPSSIRKNHKRRRFIEQLEMNPAKYLPEVENSDLADEVIKIDLNLPMDKIQAILSSNSIKTRLSLTGPMIVARDAAHAKIKERIDGGEPMPDYFRNHAIYYAGPAKTPEGYASGSFWPDHRRVEWTPMLRNFRRKVAPL